MTQKSPNPSGTLAEGFLDDVAVTGGSAPEPETTDSGSVDTPDDETVGGRDDDSTDTRSGAVEALLAFSDSLSAHGAELKAMTTQVERFHERSRAQEDIIGRMQARLEELQADQVRALLGPVASELAMLHGELTEAAARDYSTASPERLAKELSMLLVRVESGLELLGMETVGAAPGVPFDFRRHTATRRIPTSEPDRNDIIAAVVRQGFAVEGAARATLPARVTVYQYDAQLAAQGATESVSEDRAPMATELEEQKNENPTADSRFISVPLSGAASDGPVTKGAMPDVPPAPTPPGYYEG